ncbi:MAG TPA: hypothetical protein VF846_21465 [Thermoanaerobaculia bacterium]|jgi:hypothetical protein
MSSLRLRAAMLLMTATLFAAIDAFPHPLPDSTIYLDVGREQVEAELRLPAAQFAIGFGNAVPHTSKALTPALRRDIARYVTDHLSASNRDGTAWCTEVREIRIVIEPGAGHSTTGVAHLYVKAALVPPSQPTPRNFALRTDLIVQELLTHRLYVYLRRDWKVTAKSVEPFVLGRFTYRTRELAIDLFEPRGHHGRQR